MMQKFQKLELREFKYYLNREQGGGVNYPSQKNSPKPARRPVVMIFFMPTPATASDWPPATCRLLDLRFAASESSNCGSLMRSTISLIRVSCTTDILKAMFTEFSTFPAETEVMVSSFCVWLRKQRLA